MLTDAHELRIQRLDLFDRIDSIKACVVMDRLVDAAEVTGEVLCLLQTYQTARAAAQHERGQQQDQQPIPQA